MSSKSLAPGVGLDIEPFRLDLTLGAQKKSAVLVVCEDSAGVLTIKPGKR